MTEIATRAPGALAVQAGQTDWTPEQRAGLQHIGLDETVSAGDLQVFLTYSQRTGLDPFAKQIYMIKRQDRWSIMAGIDGLRVIAARSQKYRGQEPVAWAGSDGQWREFWDENTPPAAARATVLHADFDRPLIAVATFREYVPWFYNKRSGQREMSPMWQQMPSLMLGKVAEALALRRAFPQDMSGLYIPEEMAQAENRDTPRRRVVSPAPSSLTLDDLAGSATMAVSVAELQATWREAGRLGLLDGEVTDRGTGEVVRLRDYLIALTGRLGDAPPEAPAEPAPAPEVVDAELPADD